ncbi:MAG: ROK family protein [Propionibacteriaceae bacterium]|nr:ROK family protein [Propionibacteriaceae bacterium]
MSKVPVLEIGGSHVTAAVVDHAARTVLKRQDLPLPLVAGREELIDAFVAAGRSINAPDQATWGVAIPGPFDYDRGIGRFERVAKFEALNGIDLGAAIRPALAAGTIRFLNDADAFGIGEVAAGAARNHRRVVCLTLGTGVGSAFIADGYPVKSDDQVPPNGFVHVLTHAGRDLEDWMSRRALRRAYAHATGQDLDVIDIAALARAGDPVAIEVWRTALDAMTETIAPWIRRFGADIVVIGGAIARSWDLVEPLITAGFRAASAPVAVVAAEHPDDAALFGAACWAITP